MKAGSTIPLTDLTPYDNDKEDRAFVCFASPERRSLGALLCSKNYRAKQVYVIGITDEPNDDRDANIREAHRLGKLIGDICDVPAAHSDPLLGLDILSRGIRDSVTASGVVTIDISTFPKNSLLITLKALELIEPVQTIRVLYTEPESYSTTQQQSHAFGLRRTGIIPTFSAPYRADRELILIMQLGYEGDRALGVWQRIQPHRTIVAIARPAYRPDWENFTERLNAPLLAALQKTDIHYVDPRDPWSTHKFLFDAIAGNSAAGDNYFIAPLGTKPEAVGVYLFTREYPAAASVIYAAPVNPKHQYIGRGIGQTWILTDWPVQR